MLVELIAHTALTPAATRLMDKQDESTDAMHLLTLAGRGCYRSYHRPRPETARDSDYLRRTLGQEGHWSIAEHATATFYIEGVSRALTHEAIRHRHLSPSELSQRFVNVEDAQFITPPALLDLLQDQNPGITFEQSNHNFREDGAAKEILKTYRSINDRLTEAGYGRKPAREAARAVMPNCTETSIYLSGNFRAWTDFLKKRWSVHADREICQLAGEILSQLRPLAPPVFEEIPDEPYS